MKKFLCIACACMITVASLSACTSKPVSTVPTESSQAKSVEKVENRTSINLDSKMDLKYASKKITNVSGQNVKNDTDAANSASVGVPYARYIFKDGKSNEYWFDGQNRLVGYTSQNIYSKKALSSSQITLQEKDIPALLDKYLKDNVVNYNQFKMVGISEIGDWYSVDMKRTVTPELCDCISVSISKSGTICALTIMYCDLDSVTDTQKAQLKSQLDSYLSSHPVSGETAKLKQTSYLKIDNKIVANYSIEFEDAGGGLSAVNYTFSIDT